MAPAPAKPSLFAHVLDMLGSQIASGAYDARRTLPREPDLCEAMGASRTVIREVVRVLAQKGMVQPQQKVGIRILPPSSWNLLDIHVLDWIWRSGQHEAYVRDFLEFRLAMEPVASFQAARRASPEAREDILARYRQLLVVNEQCAAGGDRQVAIDTDIGFHTAVFAASRNQFTSYLGTLVTHMLRRQIHATTDTPGEFARGLHLHGAVAEAIARGDAEAAFNSSYELVFMPYERYMERVFAKQAATFPMLRLAR